MMDTNKPYIGWVDFGEEDQKRAKEFLRKFNSDDTVDELGFGIMRNAFSDMFFPATNTVMTHVRYLIFIPSIMIFLENNGVCSKEMSKKCRDMENAIREVLSKTEKDGVIGKEAEEKLKRYPSYIYWNALKTLDIYRHQHTQGYYYSHIDDFYRSNTIVKDDDKNPHIFGELNYNWDNEFIYHDEAPFIDKKTGEFDNKTNFKLTKEEAVYLKKQFGCLALNKGTSIISYALSTEKFHDFKYPWDIKTNDSALNEKIEHAKYLSIMVKGVRLQYFQMLIEALVEMNHITEQGNMMGPFKLWWDSSRQSLINWDLKRFFEIVTENDALRNGDRDFFTDWMKHLRNNKNAEKFFVDLQIRKFIRDHEKRKRPVKARLSHEKYLKQWVMPNLNDADYKDKRNIPYSLDFRSDIGRTFIQELRAHRR